MTEPVVDELIVKVTARARLLAIEKGQHYQPIDIVMDIRSIRETGGLDGDARLAADDEDFEHYIFGIRQNIDRSSFPGKLTGKFKPRFATK